MPLFFEEELFLKNKVPKRLLQTLFSRGKNFSLTEEVEKNKESGITRKSGRDEILSSLIPFPSLCRQSLSLPLRVMRPRFFGEQCSARAFDCWCSTISPWGWTSRFPGWISFKWFFLLSLRNWPLLPVTIRFLPNLSQWLEYTDVTSLSVPSSSLSLMSASSLCPYDVQVHISVCRPTISALCLSFFQSLSWCLFFFVSPVLAKSAVGAKIETFHPWILLGRKEKGHFRVGRKCPKSMLSLHQVF